jgi:hypothetical protein
MHSRPPPGIEASAAPDNALRKVGLDGSAAPDLAEWDRLPRTQIISEKSAAACPYVGGSSQRPRSIRTMQRWRAARRGPKYQKIGGRYYYEIGALRDFYQQSVRGDVD